MTDSMQTLSDKLNKHLVECAASTATLTSEVADARQDIGELRGFMTKATVAVIAGLLTVLGALLLQILMKAGVL